MTSLKIGIVFSNLIEPTLRLVLGALASSPAVLELFYWRRAGEDACGPTRGDHERSETSLKMKRVFSNLIEPKLSLVLGAASSLAVRGILACPLKHSTLH